MATLAMAPLLGPPGVPRRFPFRVSGCVGGFPLCFKAEGRAQGQRSPETALASRAHEALKHEGPPPTQPETRKGNPWNAWCILRGGQRRARTVALSQISVTSTVIHL